MREKDSPFSEGGERDKFWESERRIFRMYFVYPDEYLATGVLFFKYRVTRCLLRDLTSIPENWKVGGDGGKAGFLFQVYLLVFSPFLSPFLLVLVGCWHYLIPDTSLPASL
jgi:hypothetical protein